MAAKRMLVTKWLNYNEIGFQSLHLRQAKSIDYLQSATEEFNSELPRKKSN